MDEDMSFGTPVDCFKSKAACSKCCCRCNNYYKALIVVVIIVAYLLLGGYSFLTLEKPNEQAKIKQRQMQRKEAKEELKEYKETFDKFLVDHANLTRHKAENFTETLVKLAATLAGVNTTIHSETDPIWNYASSVLFASTVITTIGYGTIAPETVGGRILFIFYALLGIPIALTCLATIGSISSDWLNAAIVPCVKRYSKSLVIARVTGTLIILVITIVFFVVIPAYIFYTIEAPNDWTYLSSIYYCIVTLTTVGFGDYVPGIRGSTISRNADIIGLYRIITTVWVWIGLALVATVISETQELIEAIGKFINRRSRNKKNKSYILQTDDHSKTDSECQAPLVSENTSILSEDTPTDSTGDNAAAANQEYPSVQVSGAAAAL